MRVAELQVENINRIGPPTVTTKFSSPVRCVDMPLVTKSPFPFVVEETVRPHHRLLKEHIDGVGSGVGTRVGLAVGSNNGCGEGPRDGMGVGAEVGSEVGTGVGSGTGGAVGARRGDCVDVPAPCAPKMSAHNAATKWSGDLLAIEEGKGREGALSFRWTIFVR